MKRYVKENASCPPGYGLVSWEHDVRAYVAYPVPINILMRWVHRFKCSAFYEWLVSPDETVDMKAYRMHREWARDREAAMKATADVLYETNHRLRTQLSSLKMLFNALVAEHERVVEGETEDDIVALVRYHIGG